MQKRILVIDNDQDLLETVETLLLYENFQVITRTTVDDILALVEEVKPDLILIDYLLYGINGGEHCHLIKSKPDTAHFPVIIFSGYPRLIHSLGTYECDAFISKPFEIKNFIETINSCLAGNTTGS